jgi:hypothetical protein
MVRRSQMQDYQIINRDSIAKYPPNLTEKDITFCEDVKRFYLGFSALPSVLLGRYPVATLRGGSKLLAGYSPELPRSQPEGFQIREAEDSVGVI